MGSEELPPVMTISQVATYLGVHELTVRRLARKRVLPALRLGRQWRVKRDLLDRWIEARSLDNVAEVGKQGWGSK